MKKSLLAIILVASGVTFANAQKKENVKVQKATKVESMKKADAKAEIQTAEMMEADSAQLKNEELTPAEEMKMKEVEDARAVEETPATMQKARKENIE